MTELREIILKMRNKKMRLRSIFLELRKFVKYEGLSDLILLNSIVCSLNDLGLDYSDREIYSVFKEVDSTDWDKNNKRQVLNPLLQNAKDKSVF